MKKIASFLGLLLAAVLVLSVAGCADDDSPSSVAVYAGTLESGVEGKVTFYDDGTWLLTATAEGQTMDMYKGTYEGDPSKDGDIKLKTTHAADDEGNMTALDTPDEFILTVTDGKGTWNETTFTRQ